VSWPDRAGSNGEHGRIVLDPHYTNVVLVKGARPGGEVGKMVELAEELSHGVPILAVLVNGGDVGSAARDAVLRCVRREWPILVITGSGNFADEIQSEWQNKQQYRDTLAMWKKNGSVPPQPKPSFISDPVLAEVIADGDLHFFSIQETPENLELSINLKLGATSLLNQACAQRQLYQTNARRHWRLFKWQQIMILFLGVFISGLAAFLSYYKQMHLNWILPVSVWSFKGSVEDVMYVILFVLPVGVAILISVANRFDDGNKWLQLRAATEAIEREVYRYRTRTGNYSDIQIGAKGNREIPLANMLEMITRQWVEGKTDFGTLYPVSTVPPVNKRTRTGNPLPNTTRQEKPEHSVSLYLPPNRYVAVRLDKKLDKFKKKTPKLAREFALVQIIILILGGSATLLAALHFELIITVTTAIATAMGAYLSYTQVTNSLKTYNHGYLSLINIKNWWIAVGEAQTDQDNIEKLVEYVETTLQSEQTGWIQQAQTVLTDLRSQQAKQNTGPSVTEPVTPGNPPAAAANANQAEPGDQQAV
jgi:ABC-type amino acid transport system permease subunit